MKIINIINNNVSEMINNNNVCVIYFGSAWCGPCRMVGPIVEQLAENNENVQVGKVDIDKNSQSGAKFGIRSIPTIMFFKDGEMVERVQGAQPLGNLQKIIDSLSKN